jgi:hypothetical protein
MSTTHVHPTTEHSCCNAKPDTASIPPSAHCASGMPGHDQSAHQAHASHGTVEGWSGAARITLHCLTGCAIGEWIGLSIGVLLDLETAARVALAIVLAYLSGFALTLYPLMRDGMAFRQAFKIVWIGEAVSIAAMEVVMNLVDYHLGGMRRGMSLMHPQYWIAFSAAAVAGYLAAWPVNYWLLKSSVKKPCH